MKKSWKKTDEGKYDLSIDDSLFGTMVIKLNSLESKAEIVAGEEKFVIKRTGFWKNKIEILNNKDLVIGKLYAETWYANNYIFEYGNTKYKITIRNNPLAEWVIQEHGKDVLAYGLDAENGHAKVRISSNGSKNPPIFDFLLWYLFVPVAAENMGDDYTFLILAAV